MELKEFMKWKPFPRTIKQIKARKKTKLQGRARIIERLNRK